MTAARGRREEKSGILLQHLEDVSWRALGDYRTVVREMIIGSAALEARLAKTRALKQGMMQELLTGRTRLV